MSQRKHYHQVSEEEFATVRELLKAKIKIKAIAVVMKRSTSLIYQLSKYSTLEEYRKSTLDLVNSRRDKLTRDIGKLTVFKQPIDNKPVVFDQAATLIRISNQLELILKQLIAFNTPIVINKMDDTKIHA